MLESLCDVVGEGRPIAGLIGGLEAAGWALDEEVVFRADGRLTWVITGRRGAEALRAEGASMADAWAAAARQARDPQPAMATAARPAPARIAHPGSFRVDFGGPARSPAPEVPARSVEFLLGRSWSPMHERDELPAPTESADAAAPRRKPRTRRRPDCRPHRAHDHARRANPNRH